MVGQDQTWNTGRSKLLLVSLIRSVSDRSPRAPSIRTGVTDIPLASLKTVRTNRRMSS